MSISMRYNFIQTIHASGKHLPRSLSSCHSTVIKGTIIRSYLLGCCLNHRRSAPRRRRHAELSTIIGISRPHYHAMAVEPRNHNCTTHELYVRLDVCRLTSLLFWNFNFRQHKRFSLCIMSLSPFVFLIFYVLPRRLSSSCGLTFRSKQTSRICLGLVCLFPTRTAPGAPVAENGSTNELNLLG